MKSLYAEEARLILKDAGFEFSKAQTHALAEVNNTVLALLCAMAERIKALESERIAKS